MALDRLFADIEGNIGRSGDLQLGTFRLLRTDVETAGGPVLAGIDSDGKRHLLVPAGEGEESREDKESRGVHIEVHPLQEGTAWRTFVDVVCQLDHLHELFAVVAQDMLDELRQDPNRPMDTCTTVLARWRQLLEKERSTLLGTRAIAALLAELLFLRDLAERNPGVVHGWCGPRGGTHDIVSPGGHLEVKSSTKVDGRFIEVNGQQQLEIPPSCSLHLGFLKLRRLDTGEHSLPSTVDALMALGADRQALLERLQEAGYHATDAKAYTAARFDVVERCVYEVNEGFPRIVNASFADRSPPNGVIRVDYVVDLSTEPPHPLNEEAVAAVFERIAGGFDA